MTPPFNLKEAIIEALTTLGGSGTSSEVKEYIRSKFGKDWKDIEKIMDDLCIESESSFFLSEDRVLRRIGQRKYSLKEAVTSELPETEVLSEEPKPSASDAINTQLEDTTALYSEKLKQILSQPVYRFATVTSKRVPTEPGVYIIHDDSAKQIIYAGRSRNLRIRLLQQHKQGNIRGSQFRKALGQKHSLDSEAEISEYIIDNCSFQFFSVESFEEMVRLEHFITAILAPVLNTELKQ
jgi:hypothetical protein